MSEPGPLAVLGVGVLSGAGYGAAAVAACVDDPATTPRIPAGSLYDEPLPEPTARILADFDVRAHLGRKGTSNLDRASALAVVACQQAIEDAALVVTPELGARVGAAIGTTVGSFRSTSNFTRETLVNDKPYQVNPSLFPNTIMNGAAGQVAIRFGLRGVNATLAGGPAGFLHALHYARSVIGRGYVDTMLVGGVEEFSAHRAWLARAEGSAEPGEAAAVACLGRAPGTGTTPALSVLASATAFGPTPQTADLALERCVQRVLAEAGVPAGGVQVVFTGEQGDGNAQGEQYDHVVSALDHKPAHVRVGVAMGDCGAAGAGLALVVARERSTDFEHCLLTARDPDGGVAVALLRSGEAA